MESKAQPEQVLLGRLAFRVQLDQQVVQPDPWELQDLAESMVLMEQLAQLDPQAQLAKMGQGEQPDSPESKDQLVLLGFPA
jgi:hypothetical protein